MINLTREEAQQVVDALDLDYASSAKDWDARRLSAYQTLRAKLSEPEPEPIGEVQWDFDQDNEPIGQFGALTQNVKIPIGTPLYTAPPQREWQGLTDEEALKEFWKIYTEDDVLFTDVERAFYRAIEAKLKEKNT